MVNLYSISVYSISQLSFLRQEILAQNLIKNNFKRQSFDEISIKLRDNLVKVPGNYCRCFYNLGLFSGGTSTVMNKG